MNAPDTLLVIPCFRHGRQLAGFLPELCAELARGRAGDVRVQVVDDGSPAAEQKFLAAEIERLRSRFGFLQPLLAHAANRGKGDAIRSGWATAPQARWLAFVDADGAAPATEVAALLARARHTGFPAVFVAVRTGRVDKPVTRFWYRRWGSSVFNQWVRCCLHFDLSDTQCGLKVIPASLHHTFVWRENGFAFDLEVLVRARAAALPVITQSITWSERSGSSLGLGAMLALFVAAWRLRHLTASDSLSADSPS